VALLRELIEIPEAVHKSDFVISLETAIDTPDKTLADYVVTEQLAHCFDRALSLVTSAVTDGRSKATYLHASFGAGKTAMMSVLHLLLQGNIAARSKPELAGVIAKYAPKLDGKKFLLVPFHFVGAESMEQVVLGGYVEHIREVHPDAPLPAVYVADNILSDSQVKRTELGDDVFFRVLSEGEAADEWGDYGAGWDGARFERALAAPAGSADRDELIGALLRTHYRAFPGQAQATSEGFVPLDAGLEAISRHAKSLGYDAIILFLDELVLWLAARMSEVAFVSREGAKVVKLVEGDAGQRPVPIVSFIARQRDLRELVGDTVPGVQSLSAIDILRHSEGRFDTITLEDRNLAAIAEKRLLRPRGEAARQQLDDAFDVVRSSIDERHERDVLLSATGDLAAFRRLYPFSPALVESLVALSGAMQRERTALKVMLQLLVDHRDEMQVGELVPLGDLFDAINAGDEPLTEAMRAQFQQARRVWKLRFEPTLLRLNNLPDAEAAERLDRKHAYVTDSRLAKTLLVAALVPEVAPLRNLTVSRLTALNSGIIRAFIPGTERQQVLDKLRQWSAEIGELRVGDDEQDPTVGVVLSGIDTAPILDAARVVDSDGERRRRIRTALNELLAIKDEASTMPWTEFTWRGTRRRMSLLFGNVRHREELPDEMLRAGDEPKVVLDFPWDGSGYNPSDDRSRVREFLEERPAEWTAVWLPNFFSESTLQLLGKLVRLDYVLGGDQFDKLASYLPPADRAAARTQLDNERSAVKSRIYGALAQAFGVDTASTGVLNDGGLALAEQYTALDPGLALQAPIGTSLRQHLESIAGQLYRYRYPKHPEFAELISGADLRHTRDQVVLALQQPNGRLENVDTTLRKVLTRVVGPLKLGTMHAAHFIADVSEWVDIIEKRRAAEGLTSLTVGQARRWIDGEGAERRGLPREFSDLVIVLVAAATNRVFLAGGQPLARPELGRINDELELRAQALPTAEQWSRGLDRARDMGVVPSSTLLSVSSVADLGTKLADALVVNRIDAARRLVSELSAAAARFGLDSSANRLRTAVTAVEFIGAARAASDNTVQVLADLALPTSAAALGTSIAQAASVADELSRTNWDLLANALDLGGVWAADAAAIRTRLVEALAADELACGLVGRLGEAGRAATDLINRAAKAAAPAAPAAPPAPAPPVPDQAVAALDVADHGVAVADAGAARRAAERELDSLAHRLRAAGLRLVWQIEDLDDDSR